MKLFIKIFFLLALFSNSAFSQQNELDDLFNKYAGKDGFTTVHISKFMLNLFASKEKGVNGLEAATKGLEGIKILTVEDQKLKKEINFIKELGNSSFLSKYETLMTIKEKDEDVRILIKKQGDSISNFLLISGGNDNTLISITGNINLNSILELANFPGIESLEKIEDSIGE